MEKIKLQLALLQAFEKFSKDDKAKAKDLADSWSKIIDDYVKAILTAWIATAVPIPQDGGAGLKTTLTAAVKLL